MCNKGNKGLGIVTEFCWKIINIGSLDLFKFIIYHESTQFLTSNECIALLMTLGSGHSTYTDSLTATNSYALSRL